MNNRWATLCLAFLALPAHATDLPSIQSQVAFDGLDRVRISWVSTPGETYLLQTTTNLAAPWQNLDPAPGRLTADTNLLAAEQIVTNAAQFYRVAWLDTQGPRLIALFPRLQGIAVPRDSTLEARLWDETGVDTNSLQVTLAGRPPVNLSDARLTYTSEVLAYRPALAELLGDFGQELTVTVVAADLAGNRSTNVWPFQLELETILSTNIVVVGGGGAAARQLAAPGELTLLSRDGSVLVYRYAGASSGLRPGQHLIDATPGRGFALTVVSLVEDASTKTVTVQTQTAALADLIQEGSVSSRAASPNPAEIIQPAFKWLAGLDLGFEHAGSLEATLVDWRDGDNFVRARLTPASHLDLRARTGFAATFRNFRLQEFEAYAEGELTLTTELLVEGNQHRREPGNIQVIAPVIKHFVVHVAGFPIEVTTKLEVDLDYDLDFRAQGHFREGLSLAREFYIARRWDGQWHELTRFPPPDFQSPPLDWQLTGNVVARAGLKPRMTALLYGVAGLYSELDPYSVFEGWAQLNPWQYQWTLFGGLDARFGSDLTVFDRLSPNLSFLREYELVPRTRVAGRDNLAQPPRILMEPLSRVVAPGATAAFAVKAEGTAPLAYQWQRGGQDLPDGGRISGARNPVLWLREVTATDAGEYRVVVTNDAGNATSRVATLALSSPPPPPGMVLIPAGTFQMGDSFGEGNTDERPVHTAALSAFYMDQTEVTKALWDEVYAWATNHGYSFNNRGSGKAVNHPVQSVNWYDVVKWCNARSEKEGRVPAYFTDALQVTVYRAGWLDVENGWVKWAAGYRLPTETEWEYAARGGFSWKRFPWGDTISHSQANYFSSWQRGKPYDPYDVNAKEGYHPKYATGGYPYTSSVAMFEANRWGLYDMVGNVWEWCWDWFGDYRSEAQANPRGPSGGSSRMFRGGGWTSAARNCRVSDRASRSPNSGDDSLYGFRCVLTQVSTD